jgi:NitT/TauT family transport system substrate-binding protein
MPKKRVRICLLAVILAVILAMMTVLPSCQRNEPVGTDSVSVGILPVAVAALIHIAKEQQFFAANHLDISIKDYNTGVASTDALLKGDVDIAWVAEFPFVRRAFYKENLSIIAVVGRFNEQYLFGRKDRRISTVADLKGKTIGIPRNTIAEFYLGRFLELNGMSMKEVIIIDAGAQDSVDAITSGRVDGVIAWEPYSSLIRVHMADRVVAFPVQSSQPGYGCIAGRNDWINGHKDTVARFLKSLAQAEEYLIRNPIAAKSLVRDWLKYDEAFTDRIWSENHLYLSLDHSLVLAMEDEARWMIKNNLVTEKQVPDFVKFIYEDGLKAIKPEAVHIIR